MPAAKCENCGHLFHWRNQRGVRLKDFKCPECGASGIKRAVWGKDYEYKDGKYWKYFPLNKPINSDRA